MIWIKIREQIKEQNLGEKLIARNDPIDRWIKGSHFAISKMKFGIQEAISPYSFDKTLISSTL